MPVLDLVLWSAFLFGVITLSIGYAASWRAMAKVVAEADRRSAETPPRGQPACPAPAPGPDLTLQRPS